MAPGCPLGLISFSLVAQEHSYQVASDIYYGNTPKKWDREYQLLDVYFQDKKDRRPVIIYVHGGGWAFGSKADVHNKPDFFVPKGYAFISMNYRLRWDYKVYHQLEDIASVVNWVHENADEYGLDSKRVFLMGNEAGAHLVSLV
ncbi:MAG: alpha/beta hydrolase, partial [Pseudomonadales bacterium]|nr:alpha/beta hydrolase [Pseudomonadales bacterium]